MSDNLPTVPTRQALAIPGRSQRMKVSGKLKTALELMVWSGKRRAESAKEAGLADASLRSALRKPHVLAWYNNELAALRTSLRAKNVHRLDTIADASANDMAKVSAIKTLELITEQAETRSPSGATQLPGIQIVIVQRAAELKPINPTQITTGFERDHPGTGH
jgi:hypothetical protein